MSEIDFEQEYENKSDMFTFLVCVKVVAYIKKHEVKDSLDIEQYSVGLKSSFIGIRILRFKRVEELEV